MNMWSVSKIAKILIQKDVCSFWEFSWSSPERCVASTPHLCLDGLQCREELYCTARAHLDSCATAQQTQLSLTIDTSGKVSIYTVFGMGIAQELTLKHHCVCAGTGFIFMVLTGLYIQISSWKHTGIFLPPMAAEITYCHHAIYQQGSFCIFTLQILLLLCLPILTSIRQWYQGDNWFFSVKQQPWGYQPSLKHPSGNWPQPLWHSNKGLSEPEPTCLLSPQHWR